MPRGRGGARTGTPGTAYTNRTDLNTPKLPVQTATGQEYGMATQQANAQRAVPMAPQATPLPQPGSMPYISPTERPNEPVTSGIDYGPGPGADALGTAPRNLPTLQQLSSNGGSQLMDQLAIFSARMGL